MDSRKPQFERHPAKPRVLKATKLGAKTLVYYDSLLAALDIDPSTEPNRPKAVSINDAARLMGVGLRTVMSMIAAGRSEQHARKADRGPHDNAAA